ncbi:hypothetical protein A0H81_02403 [Grifola frondosa]|uniref:Uncharacterized protein n=1 Tax=Grifola frondosa TaxID=5627 RepID=A0A1C7ML64_GRIFR|nr:hypothetical protein A0H81_02403 [Grifola frondosa]
MSSLVDLRIETANMAGTALSMMTYGVHITLFFSTIRLYIEPPSARKRDWRLLTYITILFCFATAGISTQMFLNHKAFIENRDYPGGPFAFLVDEVDSPMNLAVTAIYVVLNWLADGMVLYRFFIVFRCATLSIVACIVMLLSLIVVGSIFLPNISSLILNLWTNTSTVPGIAYLTLSLSLNVILTFAIVGRLVYLRRQSRKIGGPGCGVVYTSSVAILVESASLYTVVAFICVIACGVNSPLQNALLPMLGQLQAIPPLLITLRVIEGRAITRDGLPATLPWRFKARDSVLSFDRKSAHLHSLALENAAAKIPIDVRLDVSDIEIGEIQYPAETHAYAF